MEAENHFKSGEFDEVLIACRKLIYLCYEWQFDIQAPGLFSMGGRAPAFAKAPGYIDQNVREPTDHIVYDHNLLEMQLLKDGINPTTFWNIWRLTPEVYRPWNLKLQEDSWIVKREFKKFDPDGLYERAQYVLDATTEILLTREEQFRKLRYFGPQDFVVSLIDGIVPVYDKASTKSKVVTELPADFGRIITDYSVPGLHEEGEHFYHVSQKKGETWIAGYIHEKFIKP
jgi:hypothetical protein